MRQILGYLREYIAGLNKVLLAACILLTAVLVWLNYSEGLVDFLIRQLDLPMPVFSGYYLLFAFAFIVPHFLFFLARPERKLPVGMIICLLAAPALFALKMALSGELHFSEIDDWNYYWNEILYWPIRLLVMLLLLFMLWLVYHRGDSFYGLTTKRVKLKPYLIMLLIMLPLIAAASTQPDFLHTYPKLKNVMPLPDGADPAWLYYLIYELCYGSDFISIEVFFRGFLIFGFIRWAGKDAILPMAVFYCTIHFGKPLGECISSFFGGILLGVVSYHTRSVVGGLIVHLGIAWLMEIGGFIGQSLKW